MEKIFPLIDGRVGGREKLEILHHFEFCSDCKKEYQCAQKMMELYQDMPGEPLPEGFIDGLCQEMEKIQPTGEMEPEPQSTMGESVGEVIVSFRDDIQKGIIGGLLEWARKRAAAIILILLAAMAAGAGLVYRQYILSSTPQAAIPQLMLAFCESQAEYLDPADKTWKPAHKATALGPGFRVRTGKHRAVIVVREGGSIRLGPDSEAGVLEPGRDDKPGVVRMEFGKGRVWVEDGSQQSICLDMPGFQARPVGTSFQVSRDKVQEIVLSCFDGMLQVAISNSHNGFDLGGGECFIFQPGGRERRMEKINSSGMEEDEWYFWNRRLKTDRPPRVQEPLKKPALSRDTVPIPYWVKIQKYDTRKTALIFPSTISDWRVFHARRGEWRNRYRRRPSLTVRDRERINSRFASLPEEVRIKIVKDMKHRFVLPASFPDNSPKLPGNALEEATIEKFARKYAHLIGEEPASQPAESTPDTPGNFFLALPPDKRVQLVRKMKELGRIPQEVPDDYTDFPSDAISQMRDLWLAEDAPPSPRSFQELPPGKRAEIIRLLKEKNRLPYDFPDDSTTLPARAVKEFNDILRQRKKLEENPDLPPATPDY
jgi:hypothetical protein